MINQKLISLKIDESLLSRLDKIVSLCDERLSWKGKPVRINRNKLINHAISFMCSSLELQIDVLDSHHHSDSLPCFLYDLA